MNKVYVFLIILSAFVLQGCEDTSGDFVCTCDYTVGTTKGSKAYDITGATTDEANAECSEYQKNLGGNAKCSLD